MQKHFLKNTKFDWNESYQKHQSRYISKIPEISLAIKQ